jgi:hypothetical protein
LNDTHVFWSNVNGAQGQRAVTRLAFDGTEVAGVGNLTRPFGVAASATHVFWVDEADTTLFRSDVALGGAIEVVASRPGENNTADVKVAGDNVFWYVKSSGQILRTATDAIPGDETPIVVASPNEDVAFALDATHIYWTTRSDGVVRKMRLPTGDVVQLAQGQDNPCAIAVDRTHVYWSNCGTGGNGAILKITKF